ncbi:hypothetical protein I316_06820 [Kwoniella heveanensis BCC8398]|uniref:D-isomer specific 2-hydroxyacid dehydrogenase NAD-binding domain-containing protein n=1 Tax=Kwoniella heveanensis BCC8398 TaxID=1296120 RepID=A0A1B9GKA3_9TREE|nr:hypothetical protein I316_06820 [Kwoniella heveanensis BCC8398]
MARPEITTVLSTLTWQHGELDQLRKAFAPADFVQLKNTEKDEITKVLQKAQVALLSADFASAILTAPNLKWIHVDAAGLNGFAKKEIFDKGLIVSGSAGRSGPALAQHAFYFALAFTYDVPASIDRQRAHQWNGAEAIRARPGLWGRKLGIVGFGYTGKEMAKLGRAFGMHVTVLRRLAGETSSDVDVMLSSERGHTLDPILDCDVIMLANSLSDSTYHMISTEQLKRIPRTSVIINMARGEVIDEAALINALRSGEIAGAGLDVFEQEPLPAESPLWDLPNAICTPHATPSLPDKTQRSINVVVENVLRYRSGENLINTINFEDLYTKG